jgi:hypothetical protein
MPGVPTLAAPFNVITWAFNTQGVTGLPAGQGGGTYAWGMPKYRASRPRLLVIPTGAEEDSSRWFALRSVDPDTGLPNWTSLAQAGPAYTDTQDWDADGPGLDDGCTGELSVTWVAPISRWLMLYNCARPDPDDGYNPDPASTQIRARLAPAPWGPWSAPTEIFNYATDGAACRWMHHLSTPACDPFGELENRGPGVPYAPYVLTQYTRQAPGVGVSAAEITFVMSTWNPYQVNVMRAVITPNTALNP